MPTARTPQSPAPFRLPDPPRREPDEMTSYDHLHKPGSAHYLALHFGRPDTTLVEAERWISAQPDADRSSGRRPDLLIAFDVNPAAYQASNGYIISEQGKPPDFVMEIASETTAETDVGEKRDEYAALGIAEYWRFDQSGEYHGTRLAGDRLVDGQYVPITIEELPDGNLQGHSAALNLNLQWLQRHAGMARPSDRPWQQLQYMYIILYGHKANVSDSPTGAASMVWTRNPPGGCSTRADFQHTCRSRGSVAFGM